VLKLAQLRNLSKSICSIQECLEDRGPIQVRVKTAPTQINSGHFDRSEGFWSLEFVHPRNPMTLIGNGILSENYHPYSRKLNKKPLLKRRFIEIGFLRINLLGYQLHSTSHYILWLLQGGSASFPRLGAARPYHVSR
jgi:hypothetical protein